MNYWKPRNAGWGLFRQRIQSSPLPDNDSRSLRPRWCSIYSMGDEDIVTKVLAEIGRRGGQARAKVLTAKQRREIATKASKAAAKARTRKAKERKAQNG